MIIFLIISLCKTKFLRLLGPELPPGFVPPDNSSDEDDSYGPDPRLMTSGEAAGYNDVNERLERSRRKMLEKVLLFVSNKVVNIKFFRRIKN